MNQQQLKNRIIGLSSVFELLEILNEIVHFETQKEDLCFEMVHLYSFANLNDNQPNKFRIFTIPKKRKGKRIVAEPKSYLYLQLLRSIKTMLQVVYRAPRCAHGFIPEKSIVSNAKSHQGKKNVYNTDLKDFFVSITAQRVYTALRARPFSFSKAVAKLIANICCVNAHLEHIESPYTYCLPQGSPASPILTNIVSIPLDRALVDFAKRYNAQYSRYADDITFSSNNWQVRSKSFNRKLQHLIRSLGFKVNPDKTHSSHIGERMEVTGLLISDNKVNVSRQYIRELRNVLYIWETYGYNDAEKSLRRFYKQEKKHHKGAPSLDNVIHGKLMYLKMVKGEYDPIYQKMYYRYLYLLNNRKKTISPTTTSPSTNKIHISTSNNKTMAKFIFFDTECNGLPQNYRASITDIRNWPRMVQLAWIVTDENGTILKKQNHIIRPEGFTIIPEVAQLTRITTDRALREGIALRTALNDFRDDFADANLIVGHNISFDLNIVGCELYREGMAYNMLLAKRNVCTMQRSTDFCAIPSNSPYGRYKWPKLEELYRKLFGCTFDGAHDALADIEATKKCYFALKQRGIV